MSATGSANGVGFGIGFGIGFGFGIGIGFGFGFGLHSRAGAGARAGARALVWEEGSVLSVSRGVISKRDIVGGLLVAMLLNWPVAWLCIERPPGPAYSYGRTPGAGAEALWAARVETPAGEVLHVRDHSEFIGYTRWHLQSGPHPPTRLDDPDMLNLKVEQGGLPFLGVESHRVWQQERNTLHGGLSIDPRITPVKPLRRRGGGYGWIDSLPLRPRPLPFLGNTLFFFGLILLSHQLGRTVKRRRRVRLHPATG